LDAEGIVGVIALLLHWRITLCVALAGALAIGLVQTIPWLTGLQGIAIALIGLFPGLIWEDNATSHRGRIHTSTNETSLLVACLSAAIVGAIWGIFSASSFHAFTAGAGLFVVCSVLWSWFVVRIKFWLTSTRAYACITVAAAAYPVFYVTTRSAL
jgi:hypothetical protein